MRCLRVEFSDGALYDIPVSIIATHRANFFAGPDRALFKSEVEIALEDNSVLLDWAVNNMNWEDLEFHAVLVRRKSLDKSAEWVNADKGIVEV